MFILSLVRFELALFTRLTIFSLIILTICNFSYFPFWFLGLDLGSDFFSCWSLQLFTFLKKGSMQDHEVAH